MELNYKEIFKNGNFGKVAFYEGEEDFFVVVNDTIVYKNHGYDCINDYKNEYLTTYTGSRIMVVTNNDIIHSYETLEHFLNGKICFYNNPIIWKRQNIEDKKETKSTRATLTLSQIKEKLGVDELTIICE
jgi:hypothetical protein